jgi:outer membrane protease
MRNILFFLVFVTVFCVFLTAPPIIQRVYSEENPRNVFSLAFQTGFLYGQSQEIVYAGSESYKYFSELLWDMKPLYYYGAAASFSWNTAWLFTGLSFNAGVPFLSGAMEDRDWDTPNHDVLTHYSVHENYTRRALLGDANLGVSIPLRYQDSIVAFLKIYYNFSYMNFLWEGYNGYGQYIELHPEYDSWDPSMPKYEFSGKVISYSQQWFLFSPGIGVDLLIGPLWQLNFSFLVSPGIWALAVDDHFKTETEFEDSLSGGIFMEPRIELTFSPNKRFAFSAGVSYRYIDGSRGANRSRNMSNGEPSGAFSEWRKNGGGAGFSALDTRLALKVFF